MLRCAWRALLVAALVVLTAAADAAAAPILQVNGSGVLTGATGVDVEGTLYDVEFVDGSCVSLFDGCDSQADFAFTSANIGAALAALLNQVFVDGPGGQFDSSPELTNGCTGTTSSRCYALVPYAPGPIDGSVYTGYVLNRDAFLSDRALDTIISNTVSLSTGGILSASQETFARFTPAAAPVPEPASMTLLGLGFGLAGMAVRRRRPRRS